MSVYTALVFDGKKQHFVRHSVESMERFRGFLTAEYGLHVVVWISEEAQCETTVPIENRKPTRARSADVLNS